jgi:hypothetical protein
MLEGIVIVLIVLALGWGALTFLRKKGKALPPSDSRGRPPARPA